MNADKHLGCWITAVVVLVAAGAQAESPEDVSGLQLWLKAEDLSLADGANVDFRPRVVCC